MKLRLKRRHEPAAASNADGLRAGIWGMHGTWGRMLAHRG